jgi:hypothetical protein
MQECILTCFFGGVKGRLYKDCRRRGLAPALVSALCLDHFSDHLSALFFDCARRTMS